VLCQPESDGHNFKAPLGNFGQFGRSDRHWHSLPIVTSPTELFLFGYDIWHYVNVV
jgi:hypothetical protein